jgi:plastocyanin
MTSKLFRPGVYWRSLLLVAGASLALVAVACASGDTEPTAEPAAAASLPADTAVPAETDDVMVDDGDAMTDGVMMDDGDAMTDDAMMDDGPSVQSAIEAFKFENLTVSVGNVITWTNQDSAPHTVTHGTSPDVNSDPDFQSGNLTQGQSYFHTFTNAGTFAYFCEVHPSITGTVTVGEAAASMCVADPAPV